MNSTVRVSTDRDGERINELLRGGGFRIDGLDWSDIEGYWLVAEMEDRIVGCLQLILGKPVGWLELLAVDETLEHMARARTVKLLAEKGIIALRLFGASAIMASIRPPQATTDPKVKRGTMRLVKVRRQRKRKLRTRPA